MYLCLCMALLQGFLGPVVHNHLWRNACHPWGMSWLLVTGNALNRTLLVGVLWIIILIILSYTLKRKHMNNSGPSKPSGICGTGPAHNNTDKCPDTKCCELEKDTCYVGWFVVMVFHYCNTQGRPEPYILLWHMNRFIITVLIAEAFHSTNRTYF